MTIDLSGLGGVVLGMRFELLAQLADVGLDSLVTISNLALLVPESPPPPPVDVPEPPVLFLLVGGLALMAARMRPRNQAFSNEVARA
jgi:hypothetical protein